MENAVILITKPYLGTVVPEDAEFGAEMLDKFLHTLERNPRKPSAIVFYTEGVRCAAEDSPLVLGLKLLESLGVRIVLCKTCLQRYGLEEKVAVGQIGGMPDIVRLMCDASKVITV